MPWKDVLNGDPIPWLLQPDPDNRGVRYFALRDLLDVPEDAPEVHQAQAAIMTRGPVPVILDAQQSDGFWVKPGSGYSPKYRGTVWQVIFLADLGADAADERVRRGCEYLLSHSIAANGGFSALQRPVPSGCIPCLNGNLLCALLRLGYGDAPRVQTALDWQARAITGVGAGLEPAPTQIGHERTGLCLQRQREAALRLGCCQGHARPAGHPAGSVQPSHGAGHRGGS